MRFLGGVGGVFGSTFSCVLLAELAVGRIRRERKSLPGAFVLAILVRGLGFGLCSSVDAGNDERGALVRMFAAVGRGGTLFTVALFMIDSLDGFAVEALLSGRGGIVLPVLAEDEAVDAVAAPGRRTGRVGDFGLGLTALGERGPDLLGTPVAAKPLGLLFAGPAGCVVFVLIDRRLGFGMTGFCRSLSADFGASPDGVCCLGVGCLGDAFFSRGCFKGGLLALGDTRAVSVAGALLSSVAGGEASAGSAAGDA